MIVLDTTVLSLAFRRRGQGAHAEPKEARRIRDLLTGDEELGVPGVVFQELLSGVRNELQFQALRSMLTGIPLLLAGKEDHVLAAEIANRCRRKGVTAKNFDCLIAATTIRAGGALFTTDPDFGHMAPHCGLRLWPADAR